MTAVDIVCPSGIYAITNTVTGKKYIGSAKNIKARWGKHLNELRRGAHHSQRLQNAWNKYGASAFVFSVVEYVDCLGLLIEKEQAHIDAAVSVSTGYNICPKAGSRLGTKHSAESLTKMTGKVFSDARRENISKGKLGKKLDPLKIAKRSEREFSQAHRDNISKAISGIKRSTGSIAKRQATRMANGGYKKTPESIEKWKATRLANQI